MDLDERADGDRAARDAGHLKGLVHAVCQFLSQRIDPVNRRLVQPL
jgi:hypothetical protein